MSYPAVSSSLPLHNFTKATKQQLWTLPQRPHTLLQLSNNDKGRYPLGTSFFHATQIYLTDIFHRKVTGQAEEFLLGFLSVIIIAVLSEIVQAVLMHTKSLRKHSVTRLGIQIAYLVDEFYHFRNILMHLFAKQTTPRIPSHPRSARARRLYTSVLVVCIALMLMAADVLTVYFTQQTTRYSSETEYNVRGYQPIEPVRESAQFLRRLSRQRPCFSPSFISSTQQRAFSINTCVLYNITMALDKPTDVVSQISVESYLHEGGSDHIVTFGDARISVSIRAVLFLNPSVFQPGTSVRLAFQTELGDGNEYFKFLHNLFIHTTFETNCNREGRSKTCEQLLAQLDHQDAVRGEVRTRELLMWHARRKVIVRNVTGYSSTFNVEIDDPFNSIDKGIYPFVLTAMVEEVQGYPGTYINVTTEERIDRIPGMISEEARLAGLVLFSTVFLVFALILAALRITLKPVSLGAMAWNAHQQSEELDSLELDGRSHRGNGGRLLDSEYRISPLTSRDIPLQRDMQDTDAALAQQVEASETQC